MTDETIESVCDWANETFGSCPIRSAINRAIDEMEEFIVKAKDGLHQLELLDEAADVCITLYRLPGIREAINKKMAINRQRKWKSNGDGTGQHIKEDKDGR